MITTGAPSSELSFKTSRGVDVTDKGICKASFGTKMLNETKNK